MTTMNYIGLDVHKKTISYRVKDVSGRIRQEGASWTIGLRLCPWTVAMEATIFSGWICDHLLPHANQIKVDCRMIPADIRDRRRTLRYRHLLVRQMVQMKNRVSGLLMETDVEYNKQWLHKVSYFRELLSENKEVH